MIANRLFAATRHLSRVPPASARFRFAPVQQLRFLADAIHFHDDDDHEWAESFKKAAVGVAEMDTKTVDADTSAQRLRDLVKSGLLRHTDLRDNPERFFEGRCKLLHYGQYSFLHPLLTDETPTNFAIPWH